MRCKHCKTKFEPKTFLQKYCMETDECMTAFREFVKSEKSKQWKKEKKEIKEKLFTKSDYLKIAQKVFNTYIRLRDKGKPCISCDKILKENDINASHYYSVGSSPNLRFNEFNVHNSCIKCNKELHGNIAEYAIRLPLRVGKENFEQLIQDRNKPALYSIDDIKEIIKIYRKKIKELEK